MRKMQARRNCENSFDLDPEKYIAIKEIEDKYKMKTWLRKPNFEKATVSSMVHPSGQANHELSKTNHGPETKNK